MRISISAATICVSLCAVPAAFAQMTAPAPYAHEPGTGVSGPGSATSSNNNAADTRSDIAPHLPQPDGGTNAGPWNYLRDARRALGANRTGEAQQALEMAETRLLDRSTPVGQSDMPDQAAVVRQVSQARDALGHGDVAGAQAAIQAALSYRRAPGGLRQGMETGSGGVMGPRPGTSSMTQTTTTVVGAPR